MPLYIFVCEECKKNFESEIKKTDKCIHCNSNNVKRDYSSFVNIKTSSSDNNKIDERDYRTHIERNIERNREILEKIKKQKREDYTG